jgi:hypothetical protein
MRAPDKLHEPTLGETPDYSWRNKLATVYNAKRTGNLFLPLPGGYNPSPGEVDRGSITPEITSVEPGTISPREALPEPVGVPSYIGGSKPIPSGFIKPMHPRIRSR